MQLPISSLQHPLIKHLVKLRQDSAYRHAQHSLVIEGLKPILEICQKAQAKLILTCDPNLVPKNIRTDNLLVCTEAVMQKASGLASNEGIIAEIPIPEPADLEGKKSILILDSINDPGNLGTLMRTALALKWDGIVIVGESCDPYNEKAVRASRGACLSLPWARKEWKEIKSLASRNGLQPLLADLNGNPPLSFPQHQGVILILSNEAHGPSKEALEWGRKISIPLSTDVESLNVAIAGAILMYVIRPPTGAAAT